LYEIILKINGDLMKIFLASALLILFVQNVMASGLKNTSDLTAGNEGYWVAKLSMDARHDAWTRYNIQTLFYMGQEAAQKVVLNSRMLGPGDEAVNCENAKVEDEVFSISGSAIPQNLKGSIINWDGGVRSFALCLFTKKGDKIAELKDIIETQPN
jgi:hypothetical protein